MLDWVRDKIAPPRFVAFVVIAVIGGLVASSCFSWARAAMIGFDAGTAAFLALMFPLLWRHESVAEMKRYARDNDANRVMLLAITSLVTLVVLVTVTVELGNKDDRDIALVILTLVLAWLFANTVYALHYAHVYYVDDSDGGLDFSGDDDPDYADFVYFAFTLGMTFQTSDTGVTTRRLRRIVTLHSLAAFVFNIGVIAFTINILGG